MSVQVSEPCGITAGTNRAGGAAASPSVNTAIVGATIPAGAVVGIVLAVVVVTAVTGFFIWRYRKQLVPSYRTDARGKVELRKMSQRSMSASGQIIDRPVRIIPEKHSV
jgi:hypothetical protein